MDLDLPQRTRWGGVGAVRAGPLVVRELREQSRRPATHWLRMAGVLFVALVTVYVAVSAARPAAFVMGVGFTGRMPPGEAGGFVEALARFFENRGNVVFSTMNLFLLAAVWGVAPLSCADALSRERREGTLGLLFLTPLRAGDVVFAKLVAHALRAGGVLLGALPMLMIPVMMGGVSWLDAVRAVLLDTGALVLALTAGLLASTWWQGPRAVVFGAIGISLGAALAWLVGWALVEALIRSVLSGSVDPFAAMGTAVLNRLEWVRWNPTSLVSNPSWFWAGRGSGMRQAKDLWPAVGLLLFALLVAWGVFRFAAASVVRHQREGRGGGLGERISEWVGRPRWLTRWLVWAQRKALEREPMLWTEFRSWRLRVGVWLMLLVTVPVLSQWVLFATRWAPPSPYGPPLIVISVLLALAASSCFQTERRTGVLELLLTAPRGEMRVIRGKAWALVLHAAPAAILVILVQGFYASLAGRTPFRFVEWFDLMLAVPVPVAARIGLIVAAGLYFSLRLRTHLAAFVSTLLVLGLVEIGREGFVRWRMLSGFAVSTANSRGVEFGLGFGGVMLAMLEGLLALGFLFLLHRDLSRRLFVGR